MTIPAMTFSLLANLEPLDPSLVPSKNRSEDSHVPLEALIPMAPLITEEPISLDCTYQMPPAYWRDLIRSIP